MRKNILNKIAFLAILVMFFGCKSKKNLVASKAITKEKVNSVRGDISRIEAKQAQFSTFSTKAATSLNIDDKSFDVTLNIRIKKGEGIWVSITYFGGLEVARALITPDSLKIMDRVNNEYILKPFSYIYKFSNEEVDYNTVEAILVGNCVPFAINDKSNVTQANGLLKLTGQTNQMIYQISLDNNLKPQATLIASENNNQKLEVKISAFEELSNQIVANKLTLNSQSGNKNIKLDMVYNKTTLNQPVEFPFNVPKRFSVID